MGTPVKLPKEARAILRKACDDIREREIANGAKGFCSDSYTRDHYLEVKRALGPSYAHLDEINDIKPLCDNSRKNSRVKNRKGPARRKRKGNKQSDWWRNVYIESDHWKLKKKQLKKYWQPILNGFCIACPNRATDWHHRTYENVNRNLEPGVHGEQMRDCTPMCRGCHNLFHLEEPDWTA